MVRFGRLHARALKSSLLVIGFLLCTLALAQEGWIDRQGHPVPDIPGRKSVGGFGGWILVTSDSDWKEKWNTPAETIPSFSEAKTVERGKRVFVLIFFANPLLNEHGNADVTCDIDVMRPNGTSSTHQTDVVCFRGALKDDPHRTYLSVPVIGFVGDPGDPAGEWVIRVTLKDNVRHVKVPLKASFVLLDR